MGWLFLPGACLLPCASAQQQLLMLKGAVLCPCLLHEWPALVSRRLQVTAWLVTEQHQVALYLLHLLLVMGCWE